MNKCNVSYDEVKNAIKANAVNVTWDNKYDVHTYTFHVTEAHLRNQVLAWAKEHGQNWNWRKYCLNVYKFSYVVKSNTGIALVLQDKYKHQKKTEGTSISNPYSEMDIHDDKADALRFVDAFRYGQSLVKNPLPQYKINTTQEKKMQEIKQFYIIGGVQFSVPNNDLESAETVLMTLAKELVDLKAERKERKKVCGAEFPLVLQDKYEREIGALLESIALLDEITELDDGY